MINIKHATIILMLPVTYGCTTSGGSNAFGEDAYFIGKTYDLRNGKEDWPLSISLSCLVIDKKCLHIGLEGKKYEPSYEFKGIYKGIDLSKSMHVFNIIRNKKLNPSKLGYLSELNAPLHCQFNLSLNGAFGIISCGNEESHYVNFRSYIESGTNNEFINYHIMKANKTLKTGLYNTHPFLTAANNFNDKTDADSKFLGYYYSGRSSYIDDLSEDPQYKNRIAWAKLAMTPNLENVIKVNFDFDYDGLKKSIYQSNERVRNIFVAKDARGEKMRLTAYSRLMPTPAVGPAVTNLPIAVGYNIKIKYDKRLATNQKVYGIAGEIKPYAVYEDAIRIIKEHPINSKSPTLIDFGTFWFNFTEFEYATKTVFDSISASVNPLAYTGALK